MYAVKMVLNELINGSRVIITNLSLKLDALNEYIQKNYTAANVNLHERVRLISENEMGRFFTIRPYPSVGPKLLTKEEWQSGKLPDYTGVCDPGVLYVLDEIHIKFNARQWMLTGQDVLFYLSQHRKLGDDVICITQAVQNVDKQFRSVTQDYTYIRNLGKVRVSFIRLPSIFIRQTYASPPGGNEQPIESGTFRLDVSGLGSLYDTAAGVSIVGKAGADTGERQKGLPWWGFLILVGLFCAVVFGLAPKLLAGYFTKGLPAKGGTPQQFKQTNQPPHTVRNPFTPTESNHVVTIPESPAVMFSGTNTPKEIEIEMADKLTGAWRFLMTDGTLIKQGDPKLEKYDPRSGLWYAGRFYRNARPEPKEYIPPSKAPEFNYTESERRVEYKVIKP